MGVCITRGTSNDEATTEESCVGVKTRAWLQRMEAQDLVGSSLPTGCVLGQIKHDEYVL